MIKNECLVLKGNLCYSKNAQQMICIPDGYLVCENGKVEGVYDSLPKQYQEIKLIDYGERVIIPGLVDLHTHAPQYSFRGLGMDLELMNWLNQNTFPEEAKYVKLKYAQKAYQVFAEDLKRSATTRACIFATIHVEASISLMDQLEESGVKCMVGKVNMDRNSPTSLCETSAEESLQETRRWLLETKDKYQNITPILTPRFLPSCTNTLLEGLCDIQKEFQLPVQSHLSENMQEIEWVKELFPESTCYGEAYNHFGLFGGEAPTVMAHCVYSTEEEVDLIKENGVFIAHCPESNTNLSSGIAPIRSYLDQNLQVGLGTDVAGGSSLSIFQTMVEATQVSKLRWRLVDQSLQPLTVEEAFYLGTKGGGAFFGKVGSFEPGYELDAVVIDDSSLASARTYTLKERVERIIYLSQEQHICAKYVAGSNILQID